MKQSIDRIDPDCAPANEHVWPQPPASLPIPSPTYDLLSKASRSSSAPSNYQPSPLSSCSTSFSSDRQSFLGAIAVGLLKRALEDGDSSCEPAIKRHHRLLQSLAFSPIPSQVDDGLFEVLRPTGRPSNAGTAARHRQCL